MIKKHIENVSYGEVLGNSIYTKEGNLLLSKNTILTSNICQKLKNNNIDLVVVFEKSNMVLKDKDNIEDMYLYAENIVYQAIYKHEKMVEKILKHHYDTYLHSVRVAILAVALGLSCLSQEELSKLAIGALFHDIGKTFISSKLLDSSNQLTIEERKIINEHTRLGYEYLKYTSIPKSSQLVCLLHHENVDGTGYPLQLSNDKIHVFAKIVKIVDVFDAMVSKRNYKSKTNPSDVMEYIFANVDMLFDFKLVKDFALVAKCYGVGNKVLLSNGNVAVIKKIENPLRPIIIAENGVELDLEKSAWNVTIKENLG